MNKRDWAQTGAGLARAVFSRFFLALALFSAGYLLLFFGLYFSLSSMTWHGDELLYRPLQILYDNSIAVLILGWICILIGLVIYYWRKSLRFVETIAAASDLLVSADDAFIRLPKELKNIEDRMNRVKQDAARNARLAKEAEQRKNDLIVYLAHDLKTPLTSVIGYLSLLRDEPQISPQLREKYLGISLDKAERLEELINEFFEITRFNLSRLTLEPSRVDLSRMLEQICYEFRPLFAQKQLRYTLRMEPGIEIRCDVAKMERVFDNLIRIAVSYSYQGGEISIGAVQTDEGAYIQFINDGDTIPAEKLARIFEQFYRLDASRSTRTGGAGLGLAIAKEIVELHGGTITATSANDAVAFTIFLPAAPSENRKNSERK